MSTPNPYAIAKAQLLASLAPVVPPASYRYRVIALMALCGIFLVLCTVQVILTCLDMHRRGKRMWVARVQRLRAGSILVFNNLLLLSLFGIGVAISMLLGRYNLYKIYYLGGSAHNATAISTLAFQFPMFGALIFSYANITAVSTVSRGRGIESAGRLWIAVHNGVLPFMLVVWFAVTIPLSVRANTLVNSVPEKVGNLVGLLTAAAAAFDASGNAGELAIQVAAASEALAATTPAVTMCLIGIATAGSLYSTLFVIAAAASLSFVRRLLRQSNANRSRSQPGSIFVTREERTVIESDNQPEFELSSPTFKKPTIAFSSEPSLPFSQTANNKTDPAMPSRARILEGSEAAALTRLAKDLSLQLPFVLVCGIIFVIIGIYSLAKLQDMSWSMTEFRNDCFAWIVVCSNVVLSSWFLVNYVRHPSRYSLETDVTKSSASAGSAFVTSKAARVDGIQITVHESGAHILNNAEYSVANFETSKNASQKDLSDDIEKFEEKW